MMQWLSYDIHFSAIKILTVNTLGCELCPAQGQDTEGGLLRSL
jgi:hypothetical protein